jgi:hypothetical protein
LKDCRRGAVKRNSFTVGALVETDAGQKPIEAVRGSSNIANQGTIAYRRGHDAVPVKDVANAGLGNLVPQLVRISWMRVKKSWVRMNQPIRLSAPVENDER